MPHRKHHFSFTKVSRLIVFSEIVATDSENRTVCGPNSVIRFRFKVVKQEQLCFEEFVSIEYC